MDVPRDRTDETSHGARVLRAGEDYSEWPVRKAIHARFLTDQLSADFAKWVSSQGKPTRLVIGSDPHTAQVLVNMPVEPREFEWSLRFGDIIHNYRSAFDALAWALAHLDGAKPHPADIKKIYFPFAETPERWARLRRGALRSMPGFVLNRLASLQPWHGGDPRQGIGPTLHYLDIQDKHKAALRVALHFEPTAGLVLSHRLEATGDENPIIDESVATAGPVTDGDVIWEFRAKSPVAEAEALHLPLALTVTASDGEDLDAFAILSMIDEQMYGTFLAVDHGMESPEWAEFMRLRAEAGTA